MKNGHVRKGIGQSSIQSIVPNVIPLESEVLNQETFWESFSVPQCLFIFGEYEQNRIEDGDFTNRCRKVPAGRFGDVLLETIWKFLE